METPEIRSIILSHLNKIKPEYLTDIEIALIQEISINCLKPYSLDEIIESLNK